ncbi:winged helix-turn-helix transcriptional regulator [Acidithiobacillus ferriphilus]|uniref:ArsR/SmtB family transcription factor n=1 Tax=Acidithiobacillus ferriphilus TaxID=1689834 RepID=UPI001C077496|nr:winged helix-turn-helix domain-containing protein [Acidithiobacillus ferriphilus]MBU2845274.1 winged helix-turn-helix transcriptional regulator [Acidithiobacillus ferriphilus]
MIEDPDVASVAALMAVPARAEILLALMHGQSRPAGELARFAGLSPQAATAHLKKLVSGGFLAMVTSGRHRYYRLASPEVAQAIEALMPLARSARSSPYPKPAQPLQKARSCYDHVAGQLGVAMTDALVRKGYLIENERDYRVTTSGASWFCDLGVNIQPDPRSRRAFTRKCLDWSERRYHLGGVLGAAMLETFLDSGWLARSSSHRRALRITHAGQTELWRYLEIELR